MAKRNADLRFSTVLDLAPMRAGLAELVKLVKENAQTIRDQLTFVTKIDVGALKKAASDGLRAAREDSRSTPKPNAPTEEETPRRRRPPPAEDAPPQRGQSLADRIAQQEAELAKTRAKYAGRTEQEDAELTEQLKAHLDELLEKRRAVMSASVGLTDKAAQAEAKAAKAALDQQIDMLQRIDAEKRKASGSAPKGKSGGPAPGGAPAQEKGQSFAARQAAEEAEIAHLREQYTGKTAREDRKLTNELIDHISELMDKKRAAISASIGLTDKAAQAEAKAAKDSLDKQIGMLRRVAAEKKSVVDEGAGAKVGISGIFRKVSDATGGLLGANQMIEATRAISDAFESLSGPFREFDKSVRDIGTLGVKNFADFKGAILDFSKTVPDSAADIAGAIGEAVGSGIVEVNAAGQANIGQGIDFAKTASQLAIAGGTSIGKAVSAIAATLNAYGKSASDAGAISDQLFNIFNLGVTSVDELAGYLSQVTPVAAAAGVSFEQVGAAIATMTKQGIKTPDATTKIRALLVELQKPQPALAGVLKAADVSIDKIKSGEITLQQAAARIGTTITSMGKSAPQMFGSIEAATTVLALSGKNAATALSDLEGISQRGTVAEGFAVQADGAEVKMKTMLNNVHAAFIGFFDTVGNGVTASLGAISQLAPTFSTLATLKTIIPKEAMDSMKDGLTDGLKLAKQLPGVFKGGGLSAVGQQLTSVFSPAAIWMVGIAAAIALLVLLYNKSETFRGIVNKVGATLVDIGTTIWGVLSPILNAVVDLLGTVGGAVIEFMITPWEIWIAVAEGIWNVISGLIGSITGLSDAGESAGNAFLIFFSALRTTIVAVQAGIEGFLATFRSIKDSIGGAFSALTKGDFSGALDAITSAGSNAGEAFVGAVSEKMNEHFRQVKIEDGAKALEDQLQIKENLDKAGRIDELKQKLADAKTDAEKNSIAAQIASELPGAVAKVHTAVDQTTGEVTKTYDIAIAKVDEYIAKQKEAATAGAGDRQLAVVQSLQAQAQEYDANVKKLDELNSKLAQQKAGGFDTSETEASIKDLESKVKDGATKLQSDLKSAKATGLLDNLTGEAEKTFADINTRYGETVIKPMERQAADSKLGDILGEAAKLKGDLDDAGQIDKLVKKIETSSDDVERKNAITALAQAVPSAVDAMQEMVDEHGNVTTAYAVNVDAARAFAQANRDTITADLATKQKGYVDGLKSQANELADNREKAKALADQIVDGTQKGKDVSGLRDQYNKLSGTIADNTTKLAKTIDAGKKYGLIKGDVKQVGEEFNLTKRETEAAGFAAQTLTTGINASTQAAADLAKEFEDARKAASTSANENIAAAAQLVVELRDKGLSEIERAAKEKQLAEVREKAKEFVKNAKDLDKVLEDEQVRSGQKKAEKKKKSGRAEDQVDEERLKQMQIRQERELKLIESELLKTAVAADQKLALKRAEHAKEMKDLRQQIADQDKTTKEGRDKAAALQRDIKAKEDTFKLELGNLEIDRDRVVKEAREKLGVDILKVEDESFTKQTELLRANAEAIREVDAKSATLRGIALIEIIRREREAKIRAAIDADADFQKYAQERSKAEAEALVKAQLDLAQAQRELNEATTDEAKAAARQKLDQAQSAFTEAQENLTSMMEDLRALFQSFEIDPNSNTAKAITTIITQTTEQITKQTSDNARRARVAARRERIADERDTAVQEREAKILEVDEALATELEANEGNQAKITQLLVDAEVKRRQIYVDSLRKTNSLFAAFLSARDAIKEVFDKKEQQKEEENAKKRKEALDKELDDIEQRRSQNLISYAEYLDQLAALDAKRNQEQEKAEEEQDSFSSKLKQAALIASQKFLENRGEAQLAIEQKYQGLSLESAESKKKRENAIQLELEKEGLSKEVASKKAALRADEDISDARIDLYTNTAALFFGRIAEMTAEGLGFWEAMGRAMISAAFDLLQAQIPIWIASIWATEVSKKGLLGVPIAAGLTVVLEGLVAGARSALGFKDGGLVPGGKQLIWINETGRSEFVSNDQAVAAGDNHDALEWANQTKRPLREYFFDDFAQTFPETVTMGRAVRETAREFFRGEPAIGGPIPGTFGGALAPGTIAPVIGMIIPAFELPMPANLAVNDRGQLVTNEVFHRQVHETINRAEVPAGGASRPDDPEFRRWMKDQRDFAKATADGVAILAGTKKTRGGRKGGPSNGAGNDRRGDDWKSFRRHHDNQSGR